LLKDEQRWGTSQAQGCGRGSRECLGTGHEAVCPVWHKWQERPGAPVSETVVFKLLSNITILFKDIISTIIPIQSST
jgi:hypothetical protein